MNTPCECGCGEESSTGSFCPGHDQRLRASLERRVGGLLALRSLVDAVENFAASKSSAEELAETVREVMNRATVQRGVPT